jgi:ribosomal protein S18 acetylase RimI-like enzyme
VVRQVTISSASSGDASWTIRDYRASDEGACRACIVELQEAERAIDPRLRPGEEMVDEYWREMRAHCETYGGVILVAESGGVVCGLVQVLTRVPPESLDEPPDTYALVAELVVRATHRSGGIGTALLAAAERHAQTAGAKELRISVMSGNTPARRLYGAHGFEPYLEILAKPLGRA